MDSVESLKAKLDQLPRESFAGAFNLYEWEGFWYHQDLIKCGMAIKSKFEALDDDVILTTSMKTGTTWLKALVLCIMKSQSLKEGEEDPLEKANPQASLKSLEEIYFNPNPNISGISSPRLFHTHFPYKALPDSVKNSNCKIVYLVRNPKDTFVSMWDFLNKAKGPNQPGIPFERAFASFSKGVHLYGPFFDHALEYWTESLNRPDKVLVLKYEDLKRDPKEQVKRLASFLGKPFAKEEDIDSVIWRCSIERLKNLEVNKTGVTDTVRKMPNSTFFRLGVVGDWKNHFTAEMSDSLDQVKRKKLEGSGLDLDD
ncbi:putative Flavonol 4'-sulfotransferase [Tripterygium wilfordii]|uniref:Sulfotransferase n=1 Tax=Tripterygium wilfordii TaxID=458696 RepID=A0A7J7DD08_TRIWF|nr:cytosolic sulfotransferase 12-like [Tripterygium wilfordii]KAF5744250.1 putative Flavonol 4'-sulfotransferase [Tripterygium wilfordii]